MTHRSATRLGLVVAAMLGASCQLIHGLDDYETGAAAQDATGGGPSTTGSPGAEASAGTGTTGAGGATGSGTTGGAAGGGLGGPGCGEPGGAGVCAPATPVEWAGPFQVYTSALGQGIGGCATPVTYYSGAPAQASCAACSCGAATCSKASFTCYSGAGCTGQADAKNVADGACLVLSVNNPVPCQAGTPTGTCAPAGGGAVLASWQTEHRLCPAAPAEGACAGGESCKDKGTGDALCILHAGIIACPAGWTGQELQAYTGQPDDGDCAPCSCGPVGCSSSGYSTCLGGSELAPEQCTGVYGVTYDPPAPSGACAPLGGGPVGGAFVPDDPVTLCCVGAPPG